MPELPEIETIRRDLEKALAGDKAVSIRVMDARLMKRSEAQRWEKIVLGQIWREFRRKGKYLWIEMANGWRMVFHMRMTGQLIVHEGPYEASPRMLIQFASGRQMGLYDQRRFAEAWLLGPGEMGFSKGVLGPDALNDLGLEQFVEIVKRRTTRIQPLLMDQRLLSGVGNIYAQEALFKAAIRPTRPGNRVTQREASILYEALQETLHTAIENRGSSSRNYRDAHGNAGFAQNLHAVYRKGGRPCPRCQSALRTTRVGGRGTVFCPKCQK